MKLDPALTRLLSTHPSLSPSPQQLSAATLTSHGGSGFASTFKITVPSSPSSQSSAPNNAPHHFFAKSSPNPPAATMFAGEAASLNAIHSVVPSLCPAALGHGEMEDSPGTYFLLTEWLDLSARSFSSPSSSSSSKGGEEDQGSGMSLAQKLARLHTTPAPVPEGYEKPMFGFPVTTCCGDTPQPNDFCSSWGEFYGERRLMAILERGEGRNGRDKELRRLVERVVGEVVPRLLRDGHLGGEKGIVPVVVHGDLWAGNKGRGRIGGRGAVEEVVFDPSACYGHGEFEGGIMNMFGGFDRGFWREYWSLAEKDEPVEEYEDRAKLYELYHHLNHYSIFGGGYRSGAVSIMRSLLKKYGG